MAYTAQMGYVTYNPPMGYITYIIAPSQSFIILVYVISCYVCNAIPIYSRNSLIQTPAGQDMKSAESWGPQ